MYSGLNTRIKLLDILKSELIMGIEHSWGDKRIITYKVSRMEIILNKSPYEEFHHRMARYASWLDMFYSHSNLNYLIGNRNKVVACMLEVGLKVRAL